MRRNSSSFEGILDRYFEGVLADNPTYAACVGLRNGEGKLGRGNASFENKQQKRRDEALAALQEVSPRDLSNEQHLDRLGLRSKLLRETEDYQRRRHTLEPSALDHVLGIYLHELQRGDVEPARAARNLRSLLAETPRFLGEAAALIDRPDRVWRRIMEQTAAGAPALFDAARAFLQKTNSQSSDTARLKAAQRSFERYHDTVMDRPLAPSGAFAIGVQLLQRRVRDELGLDYSLGEIEALANAEVERVQALLKAACRKFGRSKRPEEVIAAARSDWEPKGDLLDLYRRETDRIIHAFKKANAVTFPKGDELNVKPVPEFMRHLFPTAAYSSPGAFEERQRGTFWVNDLSLTKSAEKEKRIERAQHFGLSLTCAHEAYPGHHLQFVRSNQHPRRWRRLFAHAVFYEGWTLWCEQMMVDLKIDRSPWLQVQQLHDALWRCHRILVDLRLQTRRYSYEQAIRHMQRHLGFTRARAEADVNWYTAQPAVPMSYWLGRLENERLRVRLMQGRGWSLKQFNDWLLRFGTLPQAWIEKYGLD
jgi:uncharacterized protein (DUF885 family)